MNFANPHMLWLLLAIPPALLAFFWWAGRTRQRLLTQFILLVGDRRLRRWLHRHLRRLLWRRRSAAAHRNPCRRKEHRPNDLRFGSPEHPVNWMPVTRR